MDKLPAVYILTNSRNGTLYTGVTSNLKKRVWEHKKNYVDMLVYFETHDNMINAITREKQIKSWKRAWKIHLVEKANPYWRDLYPEIV